MGNQGIGSIMEVLVRSQSISSDRENVYFQNTTERCTGVKCLEGSDCISLDSQMV